MVCCASCGDDLPAHPKDAVVCNVVDDMIVIYRALDGADAERLFFCDSGCLSGFL